MSVLHIPEDLLRRLGPSDRDALTEIATRLYETGRLRFDEAARLAGVDWLRREIDGFVEYLKGSPPADPAAPVLVPGEPERLARAERSRSGIHVDATTWEDLLQSAEAVGVVRADAEALVA